MRETFKPMETDIIRYYGECRKITLKGKNVIVEGVTDVDIFYLTAKLYFEKSGIDLLENLAIFEAGRGNEGGVSGVVRELITLRNMARITFDESGKIKYRFIGLLDYDTHGRQGIINAKRSDTSIVEFLDIFLLRPVMPETGPFDPAGLNKNFDKINSNFKGLDWEIEDLVSETLFSSFLFDFPDFKVRQKEVSGKTHKDFCKDGKAAFIRYVKENAILDDLEEVVKVLKSLRFLLRLKNFDIKT